MNWQLLRQTFFLLGLALSSGCASLGEVDRSLLNQGKMNLSDGLVIGESSPLSGLRVLGGVTANGGCSTCAH